MGFETQEVERKVLTNFRKMPTICPPIVEKVIALLKTAGLVGLVVMGHTSEPVCEIPAEVNKIGIVFLGWLNSVAAAEKQGIEVESHAMSTVVEHQHLIKFWEV